MVCRSSASVLVASVADPERGDRAVSGNPGSSRASLTPIDHLTIERRHLRDANISARVIRTIEASRRLSTMIIYNSTWSTFIAWCQSVLTDPISALFPQDGLDKGLSHSTVHRQVADLSILLEGESRQPLAQHPVVRRILKGATNLRPLVVHRFPTWDLSTVL